MIITSLLDTDLRFCGRQRLAFGVGTNLTNDLAYGALQIVIKVVPVTVNPSPSGPIHRLTTCATIKPI